MNSGTIYDLIPQEGYEGVTCVNSEDFGRFRELFNGTPKRDTWEPLRVRRFVERRSRRPADFPDMALNDVLVMRTSAVTSLRDMLEAGGEILPLATDDDVPLFILNVTRVIDALDLEHSVERFPDGRIAYLDAPAFHADMVRDVDFFKLPTLRSNTIFLGERFVARVRTAKLVGLDFEPVWSPAGGPIRRRLF